MEMHDIAAKKKQCEAEMAAKEPILEVKGEGNPYTLANVPTLKQIQEAIRPYRVACLILTMLSLVLLLVIVVLLVKMKTGSSACPMNAVGWKSPTCTVEQCRTFTSQHQDRCYCCQQCPPRWVRLGQSCFFLSTLRLSWEESRNNCTGEGGSLAVVRSQKVQSFLTQNGNGRKYWIGLRSTNDTWTWIDDNVLQQSYWGATQTTGDCGILSSDKLADNNWITSPCSSYTYYICQMQL
ncbi:killer cell lectin-like receptor subfamily B member 1B allele C isoform X2 [Hippocampus comes]|uniref:killer cell lectin-like receptor subfamily B member 1B allele C isoform X2 n=1 Tax=Hippocampus comes TaxID=109280 RepID=UPI00094E7421|nr:PREDICTED: killer cell lectin-like receptor subfamily B member 1B allele C isoform X2 [Hippocampus comes]